MMAAAALSPSNSSAQADSPRLGDDGGGPVSSRGLTTWEGGVGLGPVKGGDAEVIDHQDARVGVGADPGSERSVA